MKTFLLLCFIAWAGAGCAVGRKAHSVQLSSEAAPEEYSAQCLKQLTEKISTGSPGDASVDGPRYAVGTFIVSGTNVTILEDRIIFVPQ